MKKFTFALVAIAMLAFTGCKNNNKEAETEPTIDETASAAQLNDEAFKAELANLIETSKKLKPAPFAKARKDGSFSLSDKEKLVKPDYLLSPSVVNDLTTLPVKYRAAGMLTADQIIAELYDMPANEYKEAINKLLADINDPALINFYTVPVDDIAENQEIYEIFVDQEYEEGRADMFWNAVAAGMVEQVYIMTRDIDKFMPMFTDQMAADLSFNFICVHDCLSKMVQFYPEMSELNEVLGPLYVINAMTVDELKEQLTVVKVEIENAREYMLK